MLPDAARHIDHAPASFTRGAAQAPMLKLRRCATTAGSAQARQRRQMLPLPPPPVPPAFNTTP